MLKQKCAVLAIFLVSFYLPSAASAEPSEAEAQIIAENNTLLAPLNTGLAEGGPIQSVFAQIQSRIDANRTATPAREEDYKKIEADLARARLVITAWRELLTAQNALYEAETRNSAALLALCNTTYGSQWLQDNQRQLRERSAALAGNGYQGELNAAGSQNANPPERVMLLRLMAMSSNYTLQIQRRCTQVQGRVAVEGFLALDRAAGGARSARDIRCEGIVGQGLLDAEGCRARFNEDGTPAVEGPRQGLGGIVPTSPAAVVREPVAITKPAGEAATPHGQLPEATVRADGDGRGLVRGGPRPRGDAR